MVAENLLSNGNRRRLSLPPEPPDINTPTTTPETPTSSNLSDHKKTVQEVKDLIRGINLKLKNRQDQNLSTMANATSPPSFGSSNKICANLTLTETISFPQQRLPQPFHSLMSPKSLKSEKTWKTSFPVPHWQRHPDPCCQFDLMP